MCKIKFYLPDFYHRFHLNTILIDMMSQNPEVFFDNIEIGAVYGAFPGSIWNGGRVNLGFCEKKDMERVIFEFNRRDIPCRFTFTNSLLEQKHLYDTFCNLSLELADNGMNEVLVNSPILEEYIRKHYPNYSILSSTTKCIRSIEDLCEEAQKDYKLVVIDSSLNHSEHLFDLTQKDNYEILVNHYCRDCCENSTAHYESVSRCQLNFSSADFEPCSFINRDFYQSMANQSFISVDDLYGKYVPAGFCHFKLDGRGFNTFKVIESYVYYLVKPEYKDRVRQALLRAASHWKE